MYAEGSAGPSSVHIQAKHSQVNVSFGSNRVLREMQFFDANLEDAQPPKFEPPPIADELVPELKSFRMLVLGGFGLREKALFARYLAWHLREALAISPGANGHRLPVKQWQPSPDLQDPAEALREFQGSTILLIPDVQPRHFGYELRHLHGAVNQHDHFAIVTTDSSIAEWTTSSAVEPKIWKELRRDAIYRPDYLARALSRELTDLRQRLPRGLLPGLPPGEPCKPGQVLVGNLTIESAALALQSPGAIQTFGKFLCEEPSPAHSERVEELLSQLRGDEHSVRRWFRQLDVRRQTLCLGLTLFDGMLDDQAFAAVESLVEEVWHNREPSLGHFDYFDLPGVSACFYGTQASRRSLPIESISRVHRKALLESGWELHRRKLIAAVPMLTQLGLLSAQFEPNDLSYISEIGDLFGSDEDHRPQLSASESATTSSEVRSEEDRLSGWIPHGPEREIFGTPARREALRNSLMEALSDLGALSLDSVEPSLLVLAANESAVAQRIAATAVARWRSRELGCSTLAFETLHRWLDQARIRAALAGQTKNDSDEVRGPDRVRATVSLTLGYASLFDAPNYMANELTRLLEDFLDDRTPIVLNRFRGHTLPLVVSMHAAQLEDLIFEKAALSKRFREPLAEGLSAACELRPEEILPILARRFERCVQERTDIVPSNESLREKQLAIILLAYGGVLSERIVDPERLFESLRLVLASEFHPYVRRAALTAVLIQGQHNFARIEPLMQALVAETTLEERPAVVRMLTQFYLRQRRLLQGGDRTVTIRGFQYPAWIWQSGTPRPLTAVESTMQKWLKASSNPVAQQIAVQSLYTFNTSPIDKKELELAQFPAGLPWFGSVPVPMDISTQRVRPAGIVMKFAALLATLEARHVRPTLVAVLPEALEAQAKDGSDLKNPPTQRVLDRLLSSPDGEVSELASRLCRALSLYRLRLPLGIAILLFLFLALVNVFQE